MCESADVTSPPYCYCYRSSYYKRLRIDVFADSRGSVCVTDDRGGEDGATADGSILSQAAVVSSCVLAAAATAASTGKSRCERVHTIKTHRHRTDMEGDAGATAPNTGDKNDAKANANQPQMPKIFLNTTDKDQICLHSPSQRWEAAMAAQQSSCSLPNLAITKECAKKHHVNHHRLLRQQRLLQAESGAGEGKRFHKSQVNVYCSPRITRRGSPTENDDSTGDGGISRSRSKDDIMTSSHFTDKNADVLGAGTEHQQQTTSLFPARHLLRFGSSQSLDSFGSVSHVSTCASSEFRYCSLDRLSLPESSTSFGGRLRRIYSNPEAPFCSLDLDKSEHIPTLRDSKSCSNLKDPKPIVNHLELEEKLTTDGGNLLSPPPLLAETLIKQFEKSQSGGNYDDNVYDVNTGSSNALRWEKENSPSREKRIQDWLQNVTQSRSAEEGSVITSVAKQ